MNIRLDGIPVGEWRYMTEAEMEFINNAVSGSSKTEEASRFTEQED
jgi:23S rRNA pseudouridine2604 synthase